VDHYKTGAAVAPVQSQWRQGTAAGHVERVADALRSILSGLAGSHAHGEQERITGGC